MSTMAASFRLLSLNKSTCSDLYLRSTYLAMAHDSEKMNK
uniref:Uncharacterized protein n=1 Tax=Triticum urartu TaxID=4572 RepID=A0A8R7R2X5_TRIUA